jgi:hypothetical protein
MSNQTPDQAARPKNKPGGRPRKYDKPMTAADYKRMQRSRSRGFRRDFGLMSTSMICEQLPGHVREGDARTVAKICEELVARSVAQAENVKRARDDVERVRANEDYFEGALERALSKRSPRAP